MKSDAIYITAARRTPVGAFLGQFVKVPATVLGEKAIAALVESTQIDASQIDEVMMGCVLEAGLGQAPARQAALGAGIPVSVPCTTVNKVCGSAMKTLMMGADMIKAGSAELIVAGGMESMSRAPHLLANTRSGYKLGNRPLIDCLIHDGLENPYDKRHMGEFGDELAVQTGITREEQDTYALESIKRAHRAADEGAFNEEMVDMNGLVDQLPALSNLKKLASLRPAFNPEGTVTAANASTLADGAAAILLASEAKANELGLPKLARLVGYVTHAQEPAEFAITPVGVIRKQLAQVGWQLEDVDLIELNEAFAVVVLAAERELGLDLTKVNVNGGSCALGHPIGATGARIIVTLVHALRQRGLKRGLACLCIGGGEATAVAVEIDD